jgi:hypothetical protein
MPRLLAFLPCERAIISKEDETATLVTVMQGVQTALPEEARGKKPLMLPMKWSVLAYWLREPGDQGVRFQQRVDFVGASGQLLLRQDSEFELTRHTHSQISNVFGFIIEDFTNGDEEYSLKLLLRRLGESDYVNVADYPVRVNVSVLSSNATPA